MKNYILACVAGLLLTVGLVGCAKTTTPNPTSLTPLQKVSVGLVEYSKGLGVLQSAAITANSQGLLSTPKTAVFLDYCKTANNIGLQATAVTRSINTLDAASGTKVLNILTPSIQALGKLITPDTPSNVVSAILALQTTLSTIQLIIAGGA